MDKQVTIAEDPPQADDMIKWAWGAMHRGDWDKACRRWMLVREMYPKEVRGWSHGALALLKAGKYEKAEAIITEAKSIGLESLSLVKVDVKLKLATGKNDQALVVANKAVKSFPTDKRAFECLARATIATGDCRKALSVLDLCSKKFPDSVEFYEIRAEFYKKNHELQKALNVWEQIFEKFPERESAYVEAAKIAELLGNERQKKILTSAKVYGVAWYKRTLYGTDGGDEIAPPGKLSSTRFMQLAFIKARMNLKSEANKNNLKYMWWIIDPVLYMVVFYLVFGVLMSRGGDGYIAYLLTGLVPFQWFAKSVQQTSSSILGAKGLLHQIRIPAVFFPIVGVIQNSGKQLVVFVMLLAFLFLYGVDVNYNWLYLPVIVLVNFVFILTFSCLVAMIVPFLRDLNNLVATGIQFTMFTSGIFYSLKDIPAEWRDAFLMNPMANLLNQYRSILIDNAGLDFWGVAYVLMVSAFFAIVIYIMHRVKSDVYPRLVAE